MKVILDNNVFISGIFWQGAPYQIIKLAEKNKIEIFTCLEILKELFGVLKREKFDSFFEEGKTTREEVFQKILDLVQICYPKVKIQLIKDDPSDNIVLACAISSQADFIISGDKHLLKLKSFQGIPIVTPQQFLRQFKKKY